MDILNFISWIKGGRVLTTLDPTQALLPVGQRDSRRDDGYLTNAITVADLLALAPIPPGGLTGTNYVYVAADGTDVENAASLQAAYTEATTMLPSATNRITVIAAPGNYNFGSSNFIMNTEYIDLVSLDGNRSIIFNSSNADGTINVVANNIFAKGVDVQTKIFKIGSNLNLLTVENCKGGNSSFGDGNTMILDTLSGTFLNCEGGNNSFGLAAIASGTFTNCKGGSFSFGANGGTASGTFNNCSGGDGAFGGAGTASGNFSNCVGGNFAFGNSPGGTPILSGKLYYCRLTSGTFNTVSSGGQTRYCLDGTNTANNQG